MIGSPVPPSRSACRVKIHEADAKSLLVAQGLPVPDLGGRPDADRGPRRRRALPRRPVDATGKVVIKAQVLVGGRGKAGGVRLASTADEAEDVGGADPRHARSRACPSGGCWSPRRPRSSRSTTSRSCSTEADPAADVHRLGGGRRRDRAGRRRQPRRDRLRARRPPARAARLRRARLAFKVGSGRTGRPARRSPRGSCRTMLAYDADLVEINPLAVIREHNADGSEVERLVCLDAKITLDDSALVRHPQHEALRDLDAEDPTDVEARRYDLTLHQARRRHRLHGQRRRPRDDHDGPRQARRRAARELPRHRRRREGRPGRGGDAPDPRRPERQGDPRQHLRRHHARRRGGPRA